MKKNNQTKNKQTKTPKLYNGFISIKFCCIKLCQGAKCSNINSEMNSSVKKGRSQYIIHRRVCYCAVHSFFVQKQRNDAIIYIYIYIYDAITYI